MKIEEVIKVVEFFLHKQCDLGRMKYTPYDDDNLIWEAVNNVFEEWKWYREQDLIPRTIAQVIIAKPISSKAEYCEAVKRINEIPKAEPPEMRDANIEEIKNTNDYLKTISKPTGIHFESDDIIAYCKLCRHYETGDGYCRPCGGTINNYEPYTSKEYKMRLIDAENAIDCIGCVVYDYCRAGIFKNCECIVKNIFDSQPIAYDIDNVIDELNYIEMKWHKTCPPPNEYGEPMCGVDCVECQIRRCREIVKRGGVYDND